MVISQAPSMVGKLFTPDGRLKNALWLSFVIDLCDLTRDWGPPCCRRLHLVVPAGGARYLPPPFRAESGLYRRPLPAAALTSVSREGYLPLFPGRPDTLWSVQGPYLLLRPV